MNQSLRVPCAYQGGKQRVASQIVDEILALGRGPTTRFYDLCCGSGAVSIELVNRGVDPSMITMLDLSSWGTFWTAIGSGSFKRDTFDELLSQVPADKRAVKKHMQYLSKLSTEDREAELYPLLQACSFGGKQIWHNGKSWENAFFRDYWEPTATSVRRSPANPMQPSPQELQRRIHALVQGMHGIRCLKADISEILLEDISNDSVVYIDPPYADTTGYGFKFDVLTFAGEFRKKSQVPLFVSEGVPLAKDAALLKFGGAKGGISGSKKGKHEEWLSRL